MNIIFFILFITISRFVFVLAPLCAVIVAGYQLHKAIDSARVWFANKRNTDGTMLSANEAVALGVADNKKLVELDPASITAAHEGACA